MKITQLRSDAYLSHAAQKIADFLMINTQAIKFIDENEKKFNPYNQVKDAREHFNFRITSRPAIWKQKANGSARICNIIPRVCNLFGLPTGSLILCYPSGKRAFKATLTKLRSKWEENF